MLRRTLLNCRLKTRVTIISVFVLLICSLLLYRAFSSGISKHNQNHQIIEHMNHQQVNGNPKNPSIPHVNILNDAFQVKLSQNKELNNDPFYANLISKDYETVRDRDLLSADSREALLKFLSNLYPSNWAQAPETDDVAMDLKYLLLDYGFDSNMTCKQIDSIRIAGSVAHTRSKYVDYAVDLSEESGKGRNLGVINHYGRMNPPERYSYVVKSSSNDMETKFACLKQIYNPQLCSTMGSYRILREVLLLSALRHPSVLKLEGYCLRGNRIATRLQEKGLIIVTEVGTPLTHSLISDSTWPERVAMALQVCRLLLYLDSSPLGSLRFTKLSLSDFVIVDGKKIKLADLDDLEVGEKSCTDNSQCEVPGTSKVVSCKSGMCEGLNHMINVNLAIEEVLLALLQNPPGVEEDSLVSRLRTFDVNMTELMMQLQVFLNKSQSDLSLHGAAPLKESNDKDLHGMSNEEQHGLERDLVKTSDLEGQHARLDEALANFIRYDFKNFAGIFDYTCAGSRVTWGCVHTVTSLLDAANLCLKDHICRSFVIFSTKPESDNLMTVLLKNGTDSHPHESSGTTLFVRHSVADIQAEDGNKESDKETSSRSPAEAMSCLDQVVQSQESVRYSREKRLMAHLGLKGMREQAWRRSALRQNLEGQSQMMKADGGGGRFVANLTKRNPEDSEDRAKNVLFVSEDGPQVYHMAFAVVYHMDRILGLYHTPPCVGRKLSEDVVDRYLRNSKWDEMFRSLIQSDGTLSGIMMPPMPKIMKKMKLTLEPIETVTSEMITLSRSEKLQLEYILLWWLGKISYASSDHQGYKGHLIHIHADRAFSNPSLNLSGFLNHCKFPHVVYESLTCFRCEPNSHVTDKASDVCSFGEEVVKRARAMFTDDDEFFIHSMRGSELAAAVNSVATSILHTVDVCIKKFGQESVLY